MTNKWNIHLPKTSFPMKGNLPIKEPQWLNFWTQNKVYEKIQNKNKSQPLRLLVDGPPYANGRIHLGTALNKILKDILIKQLNMSGFQSPFTPIWDCHGLPIELRALKKIKSRKPQDVRQACRKTALHWMSVQKQQFQRLGILADWENQWLTMDFQYEAEEVRILSQLVQKNLIYRGKKPIHWCSRLQTATAVSEVEYQNHKSPAIDVRFEIQDPSFPNTSFVIWTTTPWTLPANQALCVHPDFEYGLYQTPHESLIIACALKASFEKRTGLQLQLKKSFKGRDLESLSYSHPFINKTFPVILGSHVTLDTGTGCVHTAPGHGADDFIIGQKYNLPVVCPVSANGKFTDEAPDWEGIHVFQANPLIIEKLKKSKHLIHYEEIEHSYPFNPRSQFPLIFRVTNQWFLKFDDSKNPVRKQALQACQDDIQFIPQWNQQRLIGMLKESPDWCLSRQRVWGVPLPIFYCTSCSHPLCKTSIMNSIAQKMEETQQGIEYYFSTPAENLLPKNIQCEKCSHREFKKGEDILDVWFDSGCCHSVVKKRKGEAFFPAHIYLEGSDQHRGWFQTSLNSSIAVHSKTPFKTLITHGFVYDLEKRKMSKSLGNITDPEDIIKKYGSEILRMWTASCDYSQDISCGEEVISRVREVYRRFRNTFRFLLGNIHDFDPCKNSIPLSQMRELDQWMLNKLSLLSQEVLQFYSQFEFHKAYQSLNHFFTVQLSSLYLDILKDRLYTFKKEGKERRSAQTVLYLLLKNLSQIMAPITSFLSEEAYQLLPGSRKESVFLESFSDLSSWNNKDLEDKFNAFLEVRQKASKEIEALRKNQKIGSSLEVHLCLTLPENLYALFKNYPFNEEFFIVSQVELIQGSSVKISVQQALGQKCCRCWCYDKQLNPDQLCRKCIKNLES